MIKRHMPSPALIISVAALFLAGTGAASAAGVLKIGTANIRNGAVTPAKLSKKAKKQLKKHGRRGARGLQGATGPQGLAGLQGTVGKQGTAGKQGATGPAGPQGPEGKQGPAGVAGAASSVAGPAGPQGPAGVAGPQGPAGTPAVDPNLLYDSMTIASDYRWSMAYDATGLGALGNEITLAHGGGGLGTVDVSMDNWPNSGTDPIQVTLNIYQPPAPGNYPGSGIKPGALIATDTESVTPPAATGNVPVNFPVTFDFTSQHVTLPSDVVYGIAYDNTQTDTGLNVNLSYESSSVPSAGGDAYPGFLFASTLNGTNGAVGGPGGEITCEGVDSTFGQYSTAGPAIGSCGLAAATPQGSGPGLLVPAVKFRLAG